MIKPQASPAMDTLNTNPTQYNSPKRKRNPAPISTIPATPPSTSPPSSMLNNTFPFPSSTSEEERQGSPRTKVAYNFQGLRLEDPSEVGRLDFASQRAVPPVDDEAAVRKRLKILSRDETEIPETPELTRLKERGQKKFKVVIGKERVSGGVDPVIGEVARGVVLSNEIDPVIFKGSGGGVAKAKGAGLARAYPSINRLADSKSRTKKRAGTPPLGVKGEGEGEEGINVVDEERAALTWHDDEITGHDPDDPDDDGEGINGIGFKPTPAEAYARAQKRRAQMMEYRNREAREARKMRSERRRGSEAVKETREETETARRVRFMEAEVKSIISTN